MLFSLVQKDTHQAYQSSAPIKKGFLNKQGGVYKNWKRRYFILTNDHLSYYKSLGVSIYCTSIDNTIIS